MTDKKKRIVIFAYIGKFLASIFNKMILFVKTSATSLYSFFRNAIKCISLFIKNTIKYIFLFIKYIIKYIFLFIKYIIKYLIISIKWVVKALGYILDKLFSFIITFVTSLGIGIIVASKFLYKYILKFLFYEIYVFIKSFILGIKAVFTTIFVTIPKIIFGFIGSIISAIINRIKIFSIQVKERFAEAPTKIKNYFLKKYNNLAIVKYYKNKKERELEVLYIDKDSEDAERTEKKHAYQYLARNASGKLVRGYFNALSRLDTHSYLLDEGYEVYEIKTSPFIDFLHGENKYLVIKISNKDLIFWLTQLSTYIKSGIPLTDAVKILSQQNKKKKYKKVFDSIVYELTMGESFSEALRKQNDVFPGLLVNMIKAAEMIGDIESTLDEMAQYYQDLEDTKKSLIGAMTYPSIIFVFSLIVVAFIMIYIIPQFEDVYRSSNIELNGLTQAVINISTFIQTYYAYIVLGMIGSLIIYIVMYRSIKAFRTAMQFIFMHIPVVGKLIVYKEMNLFAKTFAALNKNNVLLTDTIEILSKITNNEIYKMIMYDTISNLLRGNRMSESFKNNWAIPELAYYMINTGESTGELATMLEKVSSYYQKEQKNIAATLKTFIEPIMIALLAVLVGVIILAILIPFFGIASAIQ